MLLINKSEINFEITMLTHIYLGLDGSYQLDRKKEGLISTFLR